MRKSNATNAIKHFGKLHTDTVNKINAVRNSTVYSDEYKQATIDKIMAEYNAEREKYMASAIESVEAIQSGFAEKRQADIRNGLASAETVNNIVNGIRGGFYSEEMVRDLIAVHADNAYAMKTIRGALTASDDSGYQSIGLEIPLDGNDRISHNLDNIISGLKETPSPTATEDGKGNFSIGFYQSGQNFDSWANYINDNIMDD